MPVRETGVGLGEEEDGHHAPVEFVKSHGLTAEVAAELLRRYGRNELEEKKTPKWIIFGQQLIQPMPLMIWYATPQPWEISRCHAGVGSGRGAEAVSLSFCMCVCAVVCAGLRW
jgi:hypothetical protein